MPPSACKKPDGEQMVQKCVLRIGSLEAKPRAEVRRARGSIVPDAVECRMNEHAILRLQREARVELEHTVRPFDCPIVAARQDLATQTRAFEGPSDDGKGDALAVRDGTDILGGGRSQTKREVRMSRHGELSIARGRFRRVMRNVSAAAARGP